METVLSLPGPRLSKLVHVLSPVFLLLQQTSTLHHLLLLLHRPPPLLSTPASVPHVLNAIYWHISIGNKYLPGTL